MSDQSGAAGRGLLAGCLVGAGFSVASTALSGRKHGASAYIGSALGGCAAGLLGAFALGKALQGADDAARLLAFEQDGITAVSTVETGAINGETAATALGRLMHQTFGYGPGFSREFTLRAGGRVDAINFETREILDLKPNNLRQIRLGERQLENYIAKLNEQFPGDPWTGRIVTYDKP